MLFTIYGVYVWENEGESEEIFLTGSVTFWMIKKFIFDRKDVPNFMLNYFFRLFFLVFMKKQKLWNIIFMS